MDTLVNIPMCAAGVATTIEGGDCNQCDCKCYFPVYESATSEKWKMLACCPCVTEKLIFEGKIPYEGIGNGPQVEAIIRGYLKLHPRHMRDR